LPEENEALHFLQIRSAVSDEDAEAGCIVEGSGKLPGVVIVVVLLVEDFVELEERLEWIIRMEGLKDDSNKGLEGRIRI